jgi:hypothetical protein
VAHQLTTVVREITAMSEVIGRVYYVAEHQQTTGKQDLLPGQ